MNYSNMKRLLMKHEGIRPFAYKCPAGKTTIGVGRNLDDKGLSEAEINFLLDNDLEECKKDLNKIYGFGFFEDLPSDVQMVQMDMRFNLGAKGYRSFKKMIQAVKELNFQEAVKQMIGSKWYTQVPKRAAELVKMMEA